MTTIETHTPERVKVTSVSISKSEAPPSPSVAGEQAEATMSLETGEHETELALNDIDFHEGPKNAAATSEPVSLPAALVDDGLLEEINAIPDKMGFKIGDVAELLDVKQYVLRYWESEFEILRPKKASNNQRMYTRKDVENAFLIRKLLYRDRFSIEGARQVLREMKQQVKKEKDISQVVQKLGSVSERLQELAAQVRRLRQSIR